MSGGSKSTKCIVFSFHYNNSAWWRVQLLSSRGRCSKTQNVMMHHPVLQLWSFLLLTVWGCLHNTLVIKCKWWRTNAQCSLCMYLKVSQLMWDIYCACVTVRNLMLNTLYREGKQQDNKISPLIPLFHLLGQMTNEDRRTVSRQDQVTVRRVRKLLKMYCHHTRYLD